MTTNVFSSNLLNKILSSIPDQFDKILILREREPNTLQLLKLAIRVFFNNILRCHFLEIHGNEYLKALWLVQNIQCAIRVFGQFNYMDYYPFVDDEGTSYIPSFVTNTKSNGDIVYNWNMALERLPYVMAANTSLKRALNLQRPDIYKRLILLGDKEQETLINIRDLSVRMMFNIGEYNSTLDKFIDIFLPINRDDDDEFYESKRYERDRDNTRAIEPTFNDNTMCLLARDSDGTCIFTTLSKLNK